MMMALNFQAAKHKKMLMERTKNCTVRLGDVSSQFPENSIVWITTGAKGEPKHKLYTAFLDKVRVKTMGTLTSADLGHQNPEINSREELIADFERIYKRRILMEDTVTVIYFSEVHDDL
ncbi:RNA-binding protein [Mitsuokella sp. AF33-22]|nr:RNA-binding protein [Mitsuokella sp. AF21-1AC]RHM54234.1 RNA-binding protein [Mitsuokella sp. AF33-22]